MINNTTLQLKYFKLKRKKNIKKFIPVKLFELEQIFNSIKLHTFNILRSVSVIMQFTPCFYPPSLK